MQTHLVVSKGSGYMDEVLTVWLQRGPVIKFLGSNVLWRVPFLLSTGGMSSRKASFLHQLNLPARCDWPNFTSGPLWMLLCRCCWPHLHYCCFCDLEESTVQKGLCLMSSFLFNDELCFWQVEGYNLGHSSLSPSLLQFWPQYMWAALPVGLQM